MLRPNTQKALTRKIRARIAARKAARQAETQETRMLRTWVCYSAERDCMSVKDAYRRIQHARRIKPERDRIAAYKQREMLKEFKARKESRADGRRRDERDTSYIRTEILRAKKTARAAYDEIDHEFRETIWYLTRDKWAHEFTLPEYKRLFESGVKTERAAASLEHPAREFGKVMGIKLLTVKWRPWIGTGKIHRDSHSVMWGF